MADKIKKLTRWPKAFAPLAAKINELVDAHNAGKLIAGPGIVLTESDQGTRIDIGTLTGTLECNEGGGGTIEITGS